MYHLRSSDRRLIENFKDSIAFFEPIDQTMLSIEKTVGLLQYQTSKMAERDLWTEISPAAYQSRINT